MSGRRDDNRDRASRSQPQAYSSARTSQFVIDAEGIDREVITADICRYLGNDALVKPGDVEASADWQAERLARSSAQYPTNGISHRDSNDIVRKSNTPIVVDYRSSNALDQSIARMDATQPRPAAPQVMYTSSSAAVPSSQSYTPSGQGYSQGYSQPGSYSQNPQGYTQPQSQQYASSQYPPDNRSYVHGSNYSVDSSTTRGGSVPQSVPRSQAVPYPSSTAYQAPAPQYYSQAGPPPSTSAYVSHPPTEPSYYSRAAPSGNYETTPEVYDNRGYQDSGDYQMQDATYTESSPYQESGSYSQSMPSGRSATTTSSSSSSKPYRERDSRDDRDRRHHRR
ncbi:transcription factor protein [Rutstroemia sp. NJR-2017a WRK4]|nr:transcription factor protein [Rutstroemia sp. NJR-2017a WRK4]